MVMTQEQTNAVRTRDEQVRSLMGVVAPREEYPLVADLFDRHLAEAEARGAAEAQGKGCEIIWQVEADGGWINVNNPDRFRDRGFTLRPLYTRPANVAALEARVKELEGALLKLIGAINRTEKADSPDVIIARVEGAAILNRYGMVDNPFGRNIRKPKPGETPQEYRRRAGGPA